KAEDGIRDATVTGVQTCALPISPVYLDREKSVDRACQKIHEAASHGAELIAFTETWLAFLRRRPARNTLETTTMTRRTTSTDGLDRKTTRLNSSHGSTSYAVSCL